MKRIIIYTLFVLCTCALRAQDAQNANQMINEIKRQPDVYLFAESTAQTWDEAQDNAKYLLCMEVENYAKELGGGDSIAGYVAKSKDLTQALRSMRGDRYRAFLYVKKTDVVSYAQGENVMVFPTTGNVQTLSDAPHQSTVVEYQPIQSKPAEPVITLTELETEMITITSGTNMELFIKAKKSENRISGFGKYSTMPSNIDCYLFVYDQYHQIVAYLRKTGNQYINLQTLKEDHISNYKGGGAIWFQPK